MKITLDASGQHSSQPSSTDFNAIVFIPKLDILPQALVNQDLQST